MNKLLGLIFNFMSDKKSTIMQGTVVSDAMDKTIVVAVNTFKTHKKYLKKFNFTKKYKVHDSENKYSVGDVVEFQGCKPMSKDKNFIVVEN